MNTPLKVVYMGTPDIATRPLHALIEHENFDVVAVVTQEDKKVGRKQVLTAPPVKTVAVEHDIPVLQPPTLRNNPELKELLQRLQPDFIVVIAYGQILPSEILEIPPHGCINVHGSLLPKYRGASPIEEALLHGDEETGLTFIRMTEQMDAGPILHVQRIPILPEDNALTLREKMSIRTAQLLPAILQDILDGVTTPIEQDERQASYCHKISKADGLLDLKTMTAAEIQNRIRAYTPWPGCFLSLGDKRLKLLQVNADMEKNADPGQIIELRPDSIAIGTKKGLLIPLEVQLQGKSAMDIQDFLRGNKELFKQLLTRAK